MFKKTNMKFSIIIFCALLGCAGKTPKPRYPSKQAYAGFVGGLLWHLRGEPNEALEYALEAIKHDPESAYLKVFAARIFLYLQKYHQAVSLLKQAAQKRPGLPDIYLVSGMVEMMQRRFEKAKASLQKASDRAPKWKEPYWAMARLHRIDDCFECEARSYKKLLEINSEDSEALIALASLQRRNGRIEKAKQHLLKLVKSLPWYGRAFVELAYISNTRGEIFHAVRFFQKALDVEDDDLSTAEIFWRFYLIHGKRKQAEELLQKLSIHGSPLYRTFLAEKYLEQGMVKEAKKAVQEALQMDSHFVEAIVMKVRLMLLRGEFEKAEALALKTAEKNIIDSEDRTALIEALVDIYLRWEKCKRGQKKIQAIISNQSLAHQTALIYFQSRCRNEVSQLAEFKKKVADQGLDEESLYKLAFVLDAAGKSKEAEKAAEKILIISPDNVQALNFLGFSWAERGVMLDKSLKFLTRAHSLRPMDPAIMDSLGWVHFKRGDLKKATKYLERALRVLPNEPELLYHMGRIQEKRNLLEDAEYTYQKALQYRPDFRIKKSIRRRLKKWEKK